jgi:chromosome partitioning protein
LFGGKLFGRRRMEQPGLTPEPVTVEFALVAPGPQERALTDPEGSWVTDPEGSSVGDPEGSSVTLPEAGEGAIKAPDPDETVDAGALEVPAADETVLGVPPAEEPEDAASPPPAKPRTPKPRTPKLAPTTSADRRDASQNGSGTNGSAASRPGGDLPAVRFSGMKIFAVANQKGGVGKTTTAVNVAACIAGTGVPTLLVDIDPQANATVGIGAARGLRPSVYDVLAGDCDASEAIHATAVDGLSLMPAGEGLAGANVELPRVAGSETLLRDALAPIADRFAFALLDCPPSLGPLTVNGLVAADRLIVPVQTEYYALEGLAALLDTVGLIQRELNPRLRVAGMLLTMHDNRTRLSRDVAAEVRQHFPELLFDTVIPRNVRISEAPSFGVPVTIHDPHCAGSDAYAALAREVAALA